MPTISDYQISWVLAPKVYIAPSALWRSFLLFSCQNSLSICLFGRKTKLQSSSLYLFNFFIRIADGHRILHELRNFVIEGVACQPPGDCKPLLHYKLPYHEQNSEHKTAKDSRCLVHHLFIFHIVLQHCTALAATLKWRCQSRPGHLEKCTKF